ncbi:Nn.00g114130.m01.CDS01 [Neocucurbitaria sp. VM-36]
MRLLTILGIIIGAVSTTMYFLESHLEKFYIFSPSELHELASEAISLHGNDTTSVVSHIVSSLSNTHADYVNLDEEWVFNNHGCAMGAMYIIHASITEYLIVYGTAIGTDGHSGRHTADDYFIILRGEELAYAPGPGVYEPQRYPQGTVNHLRRGEVIQYKMQPESFALDIHEYIGFPDVVEDDMDHWQADAWKFGHREALMERDRYQGWRMMTGTLSMENVWLA